ncbi:MAG: hypothetical protein BJ554DRAFT_1630 [Olpidium bornovanus]|uniref:Uncharacterized protein n=1 Tax=Olpidium bornovanus TaxID=278681 RepID=A0A8H7ZSD4_9FUNG|nr:MAG: hypothetical protein BJ554DRAFT_1630 [Olpidium bornovanus]
MAAGTARRPSGREHRGYSSRRRGAPPTTGRVSRCERFPPRPPT